jgi:hypothetical protein
MTTMQTVLYVSPMRTGDEVEVRRIHERFPLDALEGGVGVERLVVFIGSGLYALEITVGNGDFQELFHRFLRTPAVTRTPRTCHWPRRCWFGAGPAIVTSRQPEAPTAYSGGKG